MPVREELSPTAELEPGAQQEPLPKPEQGHKAQLESMLEESMSETPSTLCPRRLHLLDGDRWKSCEQCCAMSREIAI
jgi:hypothetical protein